MGDLIVMGRIFSNYEIDENVVHCKDCLHYLKHDKYFGYCRHHEQQCKWDDTCSDVRCKV